MRQEIKFMSILCKIGIHSWNACTCNRCQKVREESHRWEGCKCTVCDKTRDAEHNWDGCKCTVCGRNRDDEHRWEGCKCTVCDKTRDTEHNWDGCKCTVCGRNRDDEHRWEGCKCTVCGRNRDDEHRWEGCKCTVCSKELHTWNDKQCTKCGKPIPPKLIAERWVDQLIETKDYHSLAAYRCTYHKHPTSSDLSYDESVRLWNLKKDRALYSLRDAGSAAVDAMLSEMKTGKAKDHDIARLLVEIGAPKAVPLLKTLHEQGTWSAYGGVRELTNFCQNSIPK